MTSQPQQGPGRDRTLSSLKYLIIFCGIWSNVPGHITLQFQENATSNE